MDQDNSNIFISSQKSKYKAALLSTPLKSGGKRNYFESANHHEDRSPL